MNLNKVLLIGNLTRDPELKSLPSGQQLASFSIATNRFWTDKQGQKQSQAEFHNCVAFARQAEVISQYCTKGSLIYVEGRIQTRSWDAQDGTKKYRTEIIVENMQFGPRGGGEGAAPQRGMNKPAPGKEDDQATAPELDTIKYPEESEEVNPNDIPF